MHSMVAFQTAAPIQAASASSDKWTCKRRAHGPVATATVPSKTNLSVQARQLMAYESFLRSASSDFAPSSNPAGACTSRPTDDAPVFQTADGALVCEWSSTIATSHQKADLAANALFEYEAFITSSNVEGVDVNRAVYLTDNGCLICKYP